jgi:hypothetical protein
MSEQTKKVNFTFNPEHFKLLEQLSRKTGKDKRTIIGEAVELALSKNLSPTRIRWNKKNHRNLDANINADLAGKAKEIHEGKLTNLAVSGILELGKSEGLSISSPQSNSTAEELQKLRMETSRISRDLSALTRKLTSEDTPEKMTDSSAAARVVKATLRKLLEELDYFKKGSDADRKKFREIIDPVEVGYIAAMLKALFDDEAFQRWVLATEFMGRKA